MDLRSLTRRVASIALVTTLALVGTPLLGQDGSPDIESVSVNPAADVTEVVIKVQGSLADAVVSDFTTESPPSITVDIVGVSMGEVAARQSGAGELVRGVDISELEDGNGAISTVKLMLAEQAQYKVIKDVDNGAVIIRVRAGASVGSDPLAAASSNTAPGGGDAELDSQQRRGQEVGAVSGPIALGGQSLASLDFENLDDVSRVVIGLSGQVDYTSAQPEPNLVVIDLPGVELPSSLRRPLDTSQFMSPVRMVRAYSTNGGVRVAVSLRRDTQWSVAPGPDDLLYINVAVPEDMRGDKALAQQSFSEVAPAGGQDEGLSGAYTSETLIGERGNTSNPQAAFGTGGGASAMGSLSSTPGFSFSSSSASASQFSGRRINIDLVDADIHSVFRLISHVSRLNIVSGDDVQGNVTVRLEDVPWDMALAAILQAKGLGAQQFGNILRIAPIETIKSEKQSALEAKRAEDELTPLKLLVIPLNYGSAGELKSQVESLVSVRGSVEVDERSNQLIIRETEDLLAQIRELVRHLDRQTPQVQIEARVVEAIASYTRSLGIQWGGELNASPQTGYGTGLFFPSSVGMQGGQVQSTQGSGGESALFYAPNSDNLAVDLGAGASTGSLALQLGSVPGLVSLDARLSALESEGYGEVLSAPRVLTLDNRPATIRQGARIPFLSTSAGGTQVQFITAALVLEVTPHITSDGKIFMDVHVENNRPDFSQAVQGQPAIQIKEAETQLLVADGDTMVIGGVYTSEENEAINRIPFFGKIPGLGWLFRNNLKTMSKNEMLVFVTPRVVTRGQ